MKRSTKIIIGCVIGVGLVGAVTAKQFAYCDDGPGFGHGSRGQWMEKRISRALDLSDTQQAELSELKSSIFESVQNMRSEKPDVSEIQALLNHEFDQTKAMQLFEQRSQTVNKMAPQLITAFAMFYNQLDAEQQEKVSEIIEHRMERRDGWGPRGRFFNE